ncbi:MAG TPA: TrkH family potassium uptake protein [Solirubrobacteraceae bacterium]|nr:TrkH family potassium uptake protein [Solirubrobacteraceae bacterium]
MLKWLAVAFAAPVAVALANRESPLPFLITGLVVGLVGFGLDRLTSDRSGLALGPREVFLVVAVVWVLVPAFGAVPFLLGGVKQLSNPVDAYFESMSGFTATGATVLTHVDALAQDMLFWRQLMHWLGGMGIIILAIAVLPRLRVGGRQLLQGELQGPSEIEPLGATVRELARRLWKVYVGVSAVGTLALAVLGWTRLDPAMSPFNAFSFATSAAATGGFAPDPESARLLAPVTQWIICALMLVAGINLLRLHRLLVLRQLRAFARDEELRLYLVLLALSSLAVGIELFASRTVHGVESGLRAATFQTVSVMTTTGFATLDWTRLGPLVTLTLLLLMFVGASSGSTTGSIKVIRHLMLFRLTRRELEQAVHPDIVAPVRVSGVVIEERALRSAVMFVALYMLVFALGALSLLLDARRVGGQLGAFEALGAAASCLGNVGPAFGSAGPFGSYAAFSDLSKVMLSILMLLGRVEIVPIAVLFTRSYWRR